MIMDAASSKEGALATMAEDAAYWADKKRIRLQGGQWSFDDHPFLYEILQIPMLQRMGRAPLMICAMKATQLGFTESMVLIVLHGQIHGWYSKGVLYLFPTNDEVREFSKTRFNPLIKANPTAIGQYVSDIKSKTDTKQDGHGDFEKRQRQYAVLQRGTAVTAPGSRCEGQFEIVLHSC